MGTAMRGGGRSMGSQLAGNPSNRGWTAMQPEGTVQPQGEAGLLGLQDWGLGVGTPGGCSPGAPGPGSLPSRAAGPAAPRDTGSQTHRALTSSPPGPAAAPPGARPPPGGSRTLQGREGRAGDGRGLRAARPASSGRGLSAGGDEPERGLCSRPRPWDRGLPMGTVPPHSGKAEWSCAGSAAGRRQGGGLFTEGRAGTHRGGLGPR